MYQMNVNFIGNRFMYYELIINIFLFKLFTFSYKWLK